MARSGGLWHHRDWWLLRRPAAGPARPRGQGGCHGKADEGDPGTAGGGRVMGGAGSSMNARFKNGGFVCTPLCKNADGPLS